MVEAKRRGIRVIDVRHEASAVFAADAVARLSGRAGVAVVTAGPGVTNAVTAVKTAQLAQSPVVLLGGAAPTILRGRGALQDIDPIAALRPHVKWAARASRVRELVPRLHEAFRVAREGVPGPVFVECPVDLLYDEAIVREWYDRGARPHATLLDRLFDWHRQRHLRRVFAGMAEPAIELGPASPTAAADPPMIPEAVRLIARSAQPVLLVGSQAVQDVPGVASLADAVTELNVPVYLAGMARGLLGAVHPLQFRHHRRAALREADLVILAGVPCDFRLDYGRQINSRAALISVNRNRAELTRNRRPTLGVRADPGRFLHALAAAGRQPVDRSAWLAELRRRELRRDEEILELADRPTEYINPVALCRAIDRALGANSVVVADGGDFVGTAAYLVSPRRPLSWLDPGVFGTLGVGAGFALGAALEWPDAEIWILYGDGAAGFSLAEFDTFVRHGIPVIAVVGNDGCWTQIARGQTAMLGDDVGTVLRRTAYHEVVRGYGAQGIAITRDEEVEGALGEAKALAAAGNPVLVNALIGTTDFRSGAISM